MRWPPIAVVMSIGSVCQSWTIEWALMDLQNGSKMAISISTPLSSKRNVLMTPSLLKVKVRIWKTDAAALSNRPSLARTAKPTNAVMPGLAFLACYLSISFSNHICFTGRGGISVTIIIEKCSIGKNGQFHYPNSCWTLLSYFPQLR